jgi:hypothetical protein
MKMLYNHKISPNRLVDFYRDKKNDFILKTTMPKVWVLIFYFIFSSIALSQPVTKVVVSGLSGYTAHETDVKKAFLLGYASYDGTQYAGQIDLHIDNSAYAAIIYADQNNYQIAVRSYTGLANSVNDTAKHHPNVLLFMPAGSNSFQYVLNLDIPNSSVVSTGAGLDTLVTGYKVEFFSIDPITNSNESSFSNGYIAGQIAFLANKFNISTQQARILARNNALINSQSTNYVQYGEINIVKAVNSALPVELTTFSGSVSGSVVMLNWATATEVNNHGFEVDRASSNQLDPGNWTKIGFVNGNGMSNSTKDYTFTDNNITQQGIYYYRLKQIDNNGNCTYSSTVSLNITAQPAFVLEQNYPNPFNPSTVIAFQIPMDSHVTLQVYDILGKKVATLADEEKTAGKYSIEFSANKFNLSSGLYVYALTAGNYSSAKKFILMK